MPTYPRALKLGLCWCAGGLIATARHPKVAKSMTGGGRSVNRCSGVIEASAVDEPTAVTEALCQLTA